MEASRPKLAGVLGRMKDQFGRFFSLLPMMINNLNMVKKHHQKNAAASAPLKQCMLSEQPQYRFLR